MNASILENNPFLDYNFHVQTIDGVWNYVETSLDRYKINDVLFFFKLWFIQM